MAARSSTFGSGAGERGTNNFRGTHAPNGSIFQGTFHQPNINLVKNYMGRSGKKDGAAKAQKTGNPLSLLTAMRASMEALQKIFADHIELESAEYSPSGKTQQQEKDRRNEDRRDFDAAQILEKCRKYLQDVDDASRELTKLKTESSNSAFSRFTPSTWSQRKVGPHRDRLWDVRADVKHYLKRSLTEGSSEVKQYLDDMSQKLNSKDSEELTDKMSTIRERQHELIATLANEDTARMGDLLPLLREMDDDAHQLERECSVIESLTFHGIKDRESDIEKEHEDTLEWAFEDEHADRELHLREWLETGNHVFWIKGHPGSGKSTLVKYVANHEKTEELLHTWADGTCLVIAKYFFWISGGSPLQTTQEGLLRSLLYTIFCSDCSLIQKVAPERLAKSAGNLNGMPWKWRELYDTLLTVIHDTAQEKRYCFFIDGLDEYKGQSEDSQNEEQQSRDIAKAISHIAAQPNVKVCAASRTWRPFEEWFGGKANADRNLRMQDHTYEDIESYTRSLLEADDTFQRRREADEDFDDLVKQIADKAEGVWLWVKRAVRQVCESLDNGGTPSEISDKVAKLPDLPGLYARDLESIHKDCKEQAAQIFLMSLHANEPIPVLTLYFAGYMSDQSSTTLFDFQHDSLSTKTQLEAMLSEPSTAERSRNTSLGDWNEDKIEKVVRKQQKPLEARCQDFMKVRRSEGDRDAVGIRDRLIFSHRTARDFLDSQYELLRQTTGDKYKINEALLKAFSLHVQLVPTEVAGKRPTFVLLLSNVLYCAVQHQSSKGAVQASSLDWIPDVASTGLRGTDFSEIREAIEETNDDDDDGELSDGTETASTASNGTTGSKKPSFFAGMMEKWGGKIEDFFEKMDKMSVDNEANIFQKVIRNPKYRKLLTAENPPKKRKAMQTACLAADPTTSLWTMMHLLPALIFMSRTSGLTRQRGRASIWGCWLQALLITKRDGNMKDIQPILRKLTFLLIEWGAYAGYVMRNRLTGREVTARTIIKEVFGQEEGDKLVKAAVKKGEAAFSTNLPRFSASLLGLSIYDPIFIFPGLNPE